MARIPERSQTIPSMNTARTDEPKCFAVPRGKGARLDASFNHPRYKALNARLDVSGLPMPLLGKFLESIAGGATPSRDNVELYTDSGIRFIRILNISDGEIIEHDIKYISDAVHNGELSRSQLAADDVLMTITGRVGSAAVVKSHNLPANINQHIVRLRIDKGVCRPEYLSAWFNCPIGHELSNRPVSGGTRMALDYKAIRNLRIPLPSLSIQDKLLKGLEIARTKRNTKIAQANTLVADIDEFLYQTLAIPQPPTARNTFSVRLRDLIDVVNPNRYHGLQTEKHLGFNKSLGDFVSLVKTKYSPEKDAPDQEIDWIRIDDLPNNPLQVEHVRTTVGQDTKGTFYQVQEGDILIARLGPTIQNAKFVLCPSLSRHTVASSEFLVLRCKRNYRPEAVLGLLRTALYREIMYKRTRGTTPSRFRLIGNDIVTIPFPDIYSSQTEVANEVRQLADKVRRLRTEAESRWQMAKQEFEKQLLGLSTSA